MRRLGALSLWLAACGAPSASAPGGTAPSPAASTPTTGSTIATGPAARPAVAAVTPAAADPVLLVTDPAALAALERHGLALGDWFVGPGTGRVVNAELGASAGYASLTAVLARDIAEVEARDPQAGVQVSRFPHRLFDVR